MRNVALGLITLSLAIAYLFATLNVPRSALDGPVGARGFPNLLGTLLAGASLLLIMQAFLVRPSSPATGPAENFAHENEAWSTPGRTALRAAGFATIAATYLVALPLLGFPGSTFLLIIAAVRYQERRPIGQVLVVSALGAIVFWLLFVKLLGIPMPAGLPGGWM